jgi:hypothetical protein
MAPRSPMVNPAACRGSIKEYVIHCDSWRRAQAGDRHASGCAGEDRDNRVQTRKRDRSDRGTDAARHLVERDQLGQLGPWVRGSLGGKVGPQRGLGGEAPAPPHHQQGTRTTAAGPEVGPQTGRPRRQRPATRELHNTQEAPRPKALAVLVRPHVPHASGADAGSGLGPNVLEAVHDGVPQVMHGQDLEWEVRIGRCEWKGGGGREIRGPKGPSTATPACLGRERGLAPCLPSPSTAWHPQGGLKGGRARGECERGRDMSARAP